MGPRVVLVVGVVVVLIVSAVAFVAYREDRDCDRWRQDYNRIQDAFIEAPTVIAQLDELMDRRPDDCPRPAGILHDLPRRDR